MKRFLLLGLLIFLYSCTGGDSGSTSLPPQNPPDTGGGSGGITVSSNPASISTYGLASITAKVRDTSGNLVADGTSVSFALSNPNMGTLSSLTATTTSGIAKVSFTAKGLTGSAQINATSGGQTGAVSITVTASPGSAISLTANPSSLSVSAMSTVTARVVDSSGNPVVDGTLVSFTLDNPTKGSLSPSSAFTINGVVATVTFTASSTASGTVKITAIAGTISNSVELTIVGTGGGTATANIALAANPSTLTTRGTSTIQATATTSTGANVPDGTVINFTLSSSIMGTITSQATTSAGIASATFTAATTPGTVIITATSGSVSKTVTVSINAPVTGSIEFASATPQVIGLKGSGQTEVSEVKFLLKDASGNPVLDGVNVSFTMNGPGGGKLPANGGEYIGDSDSTPTTATASTVNGYATVMLHSGNVAGPVTIIATVTGSSPVISSSSAVISIGGGVLSATHFSLAVSPFNLAGFNVYNLKATIWAYLADRFGNYNVLTGTSVSFYTEAGAIDRSAVTDSTGLTSVTFRTQAPMPADVAPLAWETALQGYLNSTYGISTTAHPRDGWVTVLATVQGEEAFNDENANGLFDSSYNTTACPAGPGYICQCSGGNPSVTGGTSCAGGSTRSEGFIDIGEPFIDKNDDGIRDSSNPFEEYIDANGNGVYNSPNGVWDGPGCSGAGCQTSKIIWTDIPLAFTGNPAFCAIAPSSSFALGSGASRAFTFVVGDANTNSLISGTTIKVTKTGLTGTTFSGTTDKTLADGVPSGPAEISFSIQNAACTTCGKTSPGTIDITVTPTAPLVGCTVSVSGTVSTD